MRTVEEILVRMQTPREPDPTGITSAFLMGALPFEHARPYLNADITEQMWEGFTAHQKSEEALITYIRDSLPRSWAVVSAGGEPQDILPKVHLTLLTYKAALWLLGYDEDDLEGALGQFQYTGKPQLWLVSKLLGLSDAQILEWDTSEWRTSMSGTPAPDRVKDDWRVMYSDLAGRISVRRAGGMT